MDRKEKNEVKPRELITKKANWQKNCGIDSCLCTDLVGNAEKQAPIRGGREKKTVDEKATAGRKSQGIGILGQKKLA